MATKGDVRTLTILPCKTFSIILKHGYMYQNQDHTHSRHAAFLHPSVEEQSFSWYVPSFHPAWIDFIDKKALCLRLGMNFVPQSFLAIFWFPVTDGALTDFVLISMIPFFLYIFLSRIVAAWEFKCKWRCSQALFHKEAQLVGF